MKTISRLILAALLLTLTSLTATTAHAQDLDLNIPGLKEDSPPPASAAPAASGASTESVDLLDMIAQGGWSMWVLGAFSFGVIGLLIFCLLDLRKKNFSPDDFVAAVAPEIDAANLEGVLGYADRADNCLGATLRAAVHFLSDEGFEALETKKGELDAHMQHASLKFNRGRVRTINYFSVLAQAAPMMGLLGTVSGMIGAFSALNRGGGGDPSAFAGDISEALITTASGLVIALPAIFCYFIFRDRLKELVADSDDIATELVAALRRAVSANQG